MVAKGLTVIVPTGIAVASEDAAKGHGRRSVVFFSAGFAG